GTTSIRVDIAARNAALILVCFGFETARSGGAWRCLVRLVMRRVLQLWIGRGFRGEIEAGLADRSRSAKDAETGHQRQGCELLEGTEKAASGGGVDQAEADLLQGQAHRVEGHRRDVPHVAEVLLAETPVLAFH